MWKKTELDRLLEMIHLYDFIKPGHPVLISPAQFELLKKYPKAKGDGEELVLDQHSNRPIVVRKRT